MADQRRLTDAELIEVATNHEADLGLLSAEEQQRLPALMGTDKASVTAKKPPFFPGKLRDYIVDPPRPAPTAQQTAERKALSENLTRRGMSPESQQRVFDQLDNEGNKFNEFVRQGLDALQGAGGGTLNFLGNLGRLSRESRTGVPEEARDIVEVPPSWGGTIGNILPATVAIAVGLRKNPVGTIATLAGGLGAKVIGKPLIAAGLDATNLQRNIVKQNAIAELGSDAAMLLGGEVGGRLGTRWVNSGIFRPANKNVAAASDWALANPKIAPTVDLRSATDRPFAHRLQSSLELAPTVADNATLAAERRRLALGEEVGRLGDVLGPPTTPEAAGRLAQRARRDERTTAEALTEAATQEEARRVDAGTAQLADIRERSLRGEADAALRTLSPASETMVGIGREAQAAIDAGQQAAGSNFVRSLQGLTRPGVPGDAPGPRAAIERTAARIEGVAKKLKHDAQQEYDIATQSALANPVDAPVDMDIVRLPAPVDISSLEPMANEILAKYATRPPVVQAASKALAFARSIKDLIGQGGVIAWDKADAMRSGALSVSREATSDLSRNVSQGASHNLGNQFFTLIDEAMAKYAGPEAASRLRDARALWARKVEVVDVLESFNKEPVKTWNTLLKEGDQNIMALEAVAKVSPASMPDLWSTWVQTQLKSLAAPRGRLDLTKAEQVASAWQRMGKDTKHALTAGNPSTQRDMDSALETLSSARQMFPDLDGEPALIQKLLSDQDRGIDALGKLSRVAPHLVPRLTRAYFEELFTTGITGESAKAYARLGKESKRLMFGDNLSARSAIESVFRDAARPVDKILPRAVTGESLPPLLESPELAFARFVQSEVPDAHADELVRLSQYMPLLPERIGRAYLGSMERLLNESVDISDLAEVSRTFKKFGPRTTTLLFGNDAQYVNDLKQMSRLLEHMSNTTRAPASGPVADGLLSVGAGGVVQAAEVVSFGRLSKLMRNPKMIRGLVQGFNASMTGPRLVNAFTTALAASGDDASSGMEP